ncbi:MAG: cob(I)yrinic acid a,c-diamide adenosyltransferase [Calditerrivibrio sp.]|nr:cob(I)yrinic acid a,c-diamide adenosyltransferase [Calditerrivibrio sp.]MCA1932744.1 cob(I)yrinic acid a,c-diamide adenosyltransferase [Calditerrivibrio sp.]MCA1979916.1 cob(I)yrinic acid a,c-diamide adenosyltransferase [Calditerrivibrio sp.]
MSIATKKGDDGLTSLYTGERLYKSDIRVDAYGTGDELISNLGLLKNYVADFYNDIEFIQNQLYKINSYLASTGDRSRFILPDAPIERLEKMLYLLEDEFGPLNHFVVPSECIESAVADICRTVCRRFERRVVEFSRYETVDKNILRFINRLSDLLFMMARVIGKRKGGKYHGFER